MALPGRLFSYRREIFVSRMARNMPYLSLFSLFLFLCFEQFAIAQVSNSSSLVSTPSAIHFERVPVASVRVRSESLTNSGNTSITITRLVVNGASFAGKGWKLPFTLAPRATKTFTITFAPASSTSYRGALAIAWTNASGHRSSTYVPLSGMGVPSGQLRISPTTLNFGAVQVGSNNSIGETVFNGSHAAITISQVGTTGPGFSYSGITPPTTLSPGQSFTFQVTFSPPSGGASQGNLAIISSAPNRSISIPLSGTGSAVGQLAITPSSLNFGAIAVGSKQTQSVNLQANSGPVTVASATIVGTQFVVSGISFPLSLSTGQSKSFSITFSPQASGVASSLMTFASGVWSSSTLPMSGSGVAAPTQHSVALSWNPSTSSNVVGYYVYRGSQPGGAYSKINSSLASGTGYTDFAVLGGQTYYYVVTAVDITGAESGYSSSVNAVIPFP